jgi:hypothetical protein
LVAKGGWLTGREEYRTSRTSDRVLADEVLGLYSVGCKGGWLTRGEEHRTSRTSDKVLADEAVELYSVGC